MKKCKQGYYYCYKDKKCKRIPMGYRIGLGGYLRKENEEEKKETEENGNHQNGNGNGNGNSDGGSNGGGVSEGWSKKYKKSIDCNNPKGFSQKAHCRSKKMKINEEGLRDWFGKSKSKDGKSGWVNVVTGDSCASDKPGEGIPKCVPSRKRASMSKKERLAAAAAKRREDPNQQKKTGAAKPTMVKTDRKTRKEEMQVTEADMSGAPSIKDAKPAKKTNVKYDPHMKVMAPQVEKEKKQVTEAKDKKGKGSGTKDACYHKVKSRYSVWPSAYASGALVKCRKVGAANWGNKSEEMDYKSFVKQAKKTLENNKKKTLKGDMKEKPKNEEWIVNNAAQYFFNEGINEDGLEIFIEELGVENFIEFVNDLAEDSDLIEAYALTGKKKSPKRLPKGTQPAKTTKKTIARGDSKIKAASPTGAFKKRPAAAKAVETAKEKQTEKKPVKSTLVKGVADTLARGALSAWQGHKAAMKKKKEGGSVASQVGAGLATAAGAMLKKGKKHLSDDYQYSDWREDFKAMEYEFIDLIKPEPLVTEASFEINRDDDKPGMGPEIPAKMRYKTSPLAKRIGKNIDRLRKDPKIQRAIRNSQNEEVETIDEAGKKCWKGYKKAGTQKLFGKTYNRCVKANEEFVDEAKDDTEIGITGKPIPKKNWKSAKKRYEFEKKRREAGFTSRGPKYKNDVTPYYNPRTRVEEKEDNIGGGNLKKLAVKAAKRVDADVDGDVDSKDMKSSEMGEFLPSPTGKKLKPKVRFEKFDWKSSIDEDWQKVNKSDKTDGMSKKAVAAYRRENPGSKLKTAVTGDPKPGSKDAKRRKSFCARSKGQQDMHNIDCSKTPDKPVCKARRRWKC